MDAPDEPWWRRWCKTTSNNPFETLNHGLVFQEGGLWPHLTVAQHLWLFSSLNPCNRKSLDALIVLLRMDSYLGKRVKNLSSGNKKKLSLVISLLSNPQFFIYDEATEAMDFLAKIQLSEIFKYFRSERNAICLFTTHHIDDIEYFCDRICVMEKGRVIHDGAIEDLKSRLGHYALRIRQRQYDKQTNIKVMEGVKRFAAVEIFKMGENYEVRFLLKDVQVLGLME